MPLCCNDCLMWKKEWKIEKYTEISMQFLEFIFKHTRTRKNIIKKSNKNSSMYIQRISRERKKWTFIPVRKSQKVYDS